MKKHRLYCLATIGAFSEITEMTISNPNNHCQPFVGNTTTLESHVSDSTALDNIGHNSNTLYNRPKTKQNIFGVHWTHRRLTPSKNQRMCGTFVPNMKDENGNELTAQFHRREDGQVYLTGTNTCKSGLCPRCFGLKARSYAERIKDTLVDAPTSVMVTLTVPTYQGISLKRIRECLMKSWNNVWTGIRRRWKDKGLRYVRVAELTHGARGNWHLHFHVVVAFESYLAESDLDAFRDDVIALWCKATRRYYLTADPEAQDVRRVYR